MSDDQTHYEVLGVSVTADSEEIWAAYKEVLSIYDSDSLSTYSLFSESERQTILARSQTACNVLMDAGKRKEYDRYLTEAGHVSSKDLKKKDLNQPKPLFSMDGEQTIRQTQKTIRQKRLNMDIQPLKDDIHDKTTVSGADLKSVRAATHLELDEIFAVTRIPLAVLRAIEGDAIQQLPPAVYLKGYIKQYAECLGLDPSVVLPAYLAYLKTAS